MRSTTDGVYIQLATPTHQEVVLSGEVTIHVDHLFLEGSVLLRDATMTQVWMKCILTIRWRATLKGAANRQGMHPRYTLSRYPNDWWYECWGQVNIPPGQVNIPPLSDYSGLATPIPASMPRPVDSGWSTLGEEPPTVRHLVEMTKMRKDGPPATRPRPSSMENIVMDRRGTGAIYEPLC